MGRRNVAKRFEKEACLTSDYGRELTLENWDAIAHTEADENCRIYAMKLGQGVTCVTYVLKDGKNWPQLKCNVQKIEPVLCKKDPPLREWAGAKLLEYEFKRCTIESRIFAAKQSSFEQPVDRNRCLEEEIMMEKQLHDQRYNAVLRDRKAVAQSIAAVSREFEALKPTVDAVISKVEAGRKRCRTLENELDNERASRTSKLAAMDEALKSTNEYVDELSDQNRELKEAVRRLKAAIKEAKKMKASK